MPCINGTKIVSDEPGNSRQIALTGGVDEDVCNSWKEYMFDTNIFKHNINSLLFLRYIHHVQENLYKQSRNFFLFCFSSYVHDFMLLRCQTQKAPANLDCHCRAVNCPYSARKVLAAGKEVRTECTELSLLST